MTTTTYHPSGLGQDVWGQSIHPAFAQQPQQYGQQPFGQLFGTQAFSPQQFSPQQFAPQLLGQQFAPQPIGQQIIAVLPALLAQQAQQLYAIAQMCTQLVSASGYQVGVPQVGQRPYPMGF